MYLLDTNILSEIRKKKSANKGVIDFFKTTTKNEATLFLSILTIGESTGEMVKPDP